MRTLSVRSIIEQGLEQGQGIVRLAPNWVPRSFCIPGRRIKLHPDDYYALGGERGGIDERWFSSTIPADNGPLTAPDEGVSQIVVEDGGEVQQASLRDAVAEMKGELIGERLWQEYGAWPMYSKFFDNLDALPFHVHHRDEHAVLVDQLGKPEAYYFPPQLNNHGGRFPYTFFGLEPTTTGDQLKERLAAFSTGDNGITSLSKAYRLEPGTGWDVPAGVLHAPGSLCTYEPQRASDVFAMYESVTGNTVISEDLLWKDVPEDRKGDLDYMVEILDWDRNVDPHFKGARQMTPRPVRDVAEMEADGYLENWIVYRSDAFSAKELTVPPGRTTTIADSAAYGFIVVQGHGRIGAWGVETPALIRYGQLTNDEFFVGESTARAGVEIANPSPNEPLVMLKHFGPGNPDLER